MPLVRSVDELPDALNAEPEKLELLEAVRALAAVKLGLIDDYTRSPWETPCVPKMTFVNEAPVFRHRNGGS